MGRFEDLPLELLPLIVRHVLKASHLSMLCLVNKPFYHFTVPFLYDKVVIYPWYKHAKAKVTDLFRTLAEHPKLAQFVHRLEIRDFPKILPTPDAYEMLRVHCARGLENASNLRSVTLTRDGAVTSYTLEPLQRIQSLKELEINGNHRGHYNPSILPGFTHLTKISLIMPSSDVVGTLPLWGKATGSTLRNLTLICKSSPLVNDSLLEDISEHVRGLEHLYLAGCPKVTHRGIWAMISRNLNGLLGLGLEGLTSSFDITSLSALSARHGGLTSLKSITLTFEPDLLSSTWINGAVDLLAMSPLEIFQVYATELTPQNFMADKLCGRIIQMHGHRLTRFSFHRLRLTLDAIEEVCKQCPNLQQLFMLLTSTDMGFLGPVLAHARHLRAVHVNLTERPRPYNNRDDALALVSQCSPTVTQFGLETRVWQVIRIVEVQEGGLVTTRPVLAAYENPEIPEQFLVVRA